MSIKQFYAHSREDRPQEEWQRLEEHKKNMAELAREFVDVFGAVFGLFGGFVA